MSNFLLTTDDNIQKQYSDTDVTVSVPSTGLTYNLTADNLSDVRVWVNGSLFAGWRLLTRSQLANGFTSSEDIYGSVSISGSTVSTNIINSTGSTASVTLKIRIYLND